MTPSLDQQGHQSQEEQVSPGHIHESQPPQGSKESSEDGDDKIQFKTSETNIDASTESLGIASSEKLASPTKTHNESLEEAESDEQR